MMDFKLNDGIYLTKRHPYEVFEIFGDYVYEFIGHPIRSLTIICNLRKRTMEVFRFYRSLSVVYPNSYFERGIVDLNDEGERWEGDTLDGVPCGFGKLFDEEGNLCYEGFLIGKMRVCFGTSYYPDVHRVQYSGCFFNNMKHGCGRLYDRRGSLINDCFWRCDELIDPKLDTGYMDYTNYSIMKYIFTVYKQWIPIFGFEIDKYPYLRSIRIMNNSLKTLVSLKITNCYLLEEIICCNFADKYSSGLFSIYDCPSLHSIHLYNSFVRGLSFTLKS